MNWEQWARAARVPAAPPRWLLQELRAAHRAGEDPRNWTRDARERRERAASAARVTEAARRAAEDAASAAAMAAYLLEAEAKYQSWGPAALAALAAAGIRGYRDERKIRCYAPDRPYLMGSGVGSSLPMIDLTSTGDPVDTYRAQVARYLADDIARSRERYALAFASLATAIELYARVGDGAHVELRTRTVRVAQRTVRVEAHEYEGATATKWACAHDETIAAHDAVVVEQWVVGSLGEERID